MERTIQNHRVRVVLLLMQAIGLSAVFYLYVALRIRPELFYHQQADVFLLDSHFFYGMVSHPGGVVDYLSAFLSPWFAWDWLGAFVVTLLVAIICLATRGLVAAFSGSAGEIAYLVPALLLLMVLGQYIHPVRLCVGLGIALLGANLYFRLGGYHVTLRLATFLVGSVLVYFAAAGWYSILACLCGCYEWSVKRRRWFGAVCVLSAAAVPYAASRWPFDLILSEAFGGLMLPRGQDWLAIPSSVPKAVAIYTAPLIFPLLAAVVLAWCRKPSAESDPGAGGPSEEAGPSAGADAPERGFLKSRLEVPLAILLLMVLADLVAFDSAQRCLLEIETNSEQQRWDEVLAWAEKLPFPDARAYDPRIIYCINRSLYFKGCLLDRMFAYPQAISTPSLTLIHQDIDTTASLTPRQCSEIFFDLGRINESEQMSYEALEHCGNRPEVLKRLVYIYVIKGEPEAARRFLLLLERSLLHRGWARGIREQLDSDPSLSALPLVVRQREVAVERDSVGNASDPEMLLEGLLVRNPRNRMALEYLMAHYLLTRQIDRLAANRYRFDAISYPQFPRHVEEALACYTAMAGLQNLDLGSRPIRPETWQRFSQFIQLERQSQGNAPVAFASLYPDFHDSYFFSFVFGHNISELGVARPPE
jgi:hypothetical protein